MNNVVVFTFEKLHELTNRTCQGFAIVQYVAAYEAQNVSTR